MSQKTVGDKTRTRGKTLSVASSSGIVNCPSSPTTHSPHSRRQSEHDSTIPTLALIMARLDRMEDKLNNSLAEIKVSNESIGDKVTNDMANLTALLADSRRQHSVDSRNLRIAAYKLSITEENNKRLTMQLNDMENRTRVCNMKLDGKPEEEGEDLRQYIAELTAYLNVRVDPAAMVSVYRMGKRQMLPHARPNHQGYTSIRPRSIMISFRSVQERNLIYFARAKLRDSNKYKSIFLNDDVTTLTRKMRDDYRSVAALARASGSEVRVHGDGVVIDGKKYKQTEQHLLPPHFSLAKAKTVQIDEGLFFHSEHSFLSNFFASPIEDNETIYPTAEHMFQGEKCRVAGEMDHFRQVILAPTPLEAKRIADQIPDSPDWRQQRETILERVLDLKFDQNLDLMDMLMDTGNLTLHEATTNSFYGIGATLHSRELRDKSFKGLNKLGLALVNKRESIRLARRGDV